MILVKRLKKTNFPKLFCYVSLSTIAVKVIHQRISMTAFFQVMEQLTFQNFLP